MTKPHFYITTAIHYANGPPHLGHAYENICADVMARFKRLDGFDVHFLTGMDEHGQKVEQKAQSLGKQPQQFCDEIAATFTEMNARLEISNTQFIRTTDAMHKKSAQEFWRALEKSGDIYLSKYAGWYSVRDEAYYTETDLTTREDGKKIATGTGTEVEWVEEESYFFRLSAYADKLLKLYDDHPDFIQPSYRRNEMISFVKQGLHDLSISRTSFKWGIPVPGADKHIMYVWIDALVNYISAIGYPDKLSKFWPADVHLIGKDILRFHAVYWPAFLMAAKVEMPKHIFVHGFWEIEGQKMSKSLGNVIPPGEIADLYGVEQMRYFLLREVPFGNDGNFSHTLAANRVNAELANNLGNLVQRTLSMIAKNCDGKVPTPGVFDAVDKELLEKSGQSLLVAARGEFEKLQFSRAIEEIIQVSTAANLYIDAQAPWTLKKTDPPRMATVLYVLAETIRNLGIIMQPFTPGAAKKILDQVAVPESERDFTFMGAAHDLKPGAPLPAPEGVFPRFVEKAA